MPEKHIEIYRTHDKFFWLIIFEEPEWLLFVLRAIKQDFGIPNSHDPRIEFQRLREDLDIRESSVVFSDRFRKTYSLISIPYYGKIPLCLRKEVTKVLDAIEIDSLPDGAKICFLDINQRELILSQAKDVIYPRRLQTLIQSNQLDQGFPVRHLPSLQQLIRPCPLSDTWILERELRDQKQTLMEMLYPEKSYTQVTLLHTPLQSPMVHMVEVTLTGWPPRYEIIKFGSPALIKREHENYWKICTGELIGRIYTVKDVKFLDADFLGVLRSGFDLNPQQSDWELGTWIAGEKEELSGSEEIEAYIQKRAEQTTQGLTRFPTMLCDVAETLKQMYLLSNINTDINLLHQFYVQILPASAEIQVKDICRESSELTRLSTFSGDTSDVVEGLILAVRQIEHTNEEKVEIEAIDDMEKRIKLHYQKKPDSISWKMDFIQNGITENTKIKVGGKVTNDRFKLLGDKITTLELNDYIEKADFVCPLDSLPTILDNPSELISEYLGVIHGDLNLGNIILVQQRTETDLKTRLIDFANMFENGPLTFDFAKLETEIKTQILSEFCFHEEGEGRDSEVTEMIIDFEKHLPLAFASTTPFSPPADFLCAEVFKSAFDAICKIREVACETIKSVLQEKNKPLVRSIEKAYLQSIFFYSLASLKFEFPHLNEDERKWANKWAYIAATVAGKSL